MISVLPRNNFSSDTVDRPSPNLWHDCPWREIVHGKRRGRVWFDDFADFPLVGTQTTEIQHGRYKLFNTGTDTVCKVKTINSVLIPGGALSIQLDTANDSGSIAVTYPTFLMDGLPASTGKLWFEGCYAQNSVATNMAAVFLGLAETDLWTLATGVPFNGGDAITNAAAAIGFRIEEDGLGVIDTVYSDRATSFTNIGDAEGGTLTAYTFKKLGMLYDPSNTSRAVRFFTDNVECSSALTLAQLTAMTNLDAGLLGFIFAACADSGGGSFDNYLKWIRIAQVLPE